MRLFAGLCLFASAALSAEWQVLYPNVMTIAIGVSAPNDKEVYVSGANDGTGAAILKSSDAGESWTSLPHDPQMMYMDVDIAKGTTFGAAPGVGMFGLMSGASFTSNGDTFESIPATPFVMASQSASAPSASEFHLVGVYQETLRDGVHDGVISSLDGGKTITYSDWALGTPARYGSFPGNNTWFVTGGSWPADESTLAGGRIPGKNTFNLSPRVQLHGSSHKIDTDRTVMGSADGYIGVIGRSTDGGKTFESIFNDTGRFYFNAIDCPSSSSCWAVAEGPAGAWIFNTVDGGKSWKEQFFGANAGLFDVKMVNAKEGWAVGADFTDITFNALFLHTTDGGQTWTNSNSITNAYPNALTVVSQDRAYATAFLRNGLSSILVYN